jgi:hypothetical protein
MSNLLSRLIFSSTFISAFCGTAFSQSCCSGGVPISNNLGLPVSDSKTIQLALSYDLNILNTLKDGSAKLNDNARRRLTQSVLFQSGYVINKKWSMEMFISWIQQKRIINQFGNTNNTIAQGLGDWVILAKYNLLPKKGINWLIGAGPKIPTGSSDKRDKNNIALNADLQPGSGAWDIITWTQISKNNKARPTLNYSGTVSFSLKGKNKSYLGSQVYQFGDELIAITGIADQYVTGTVLWGASLQAMYRYAFQDENNGEKTPGTGGKWVFIRPGVSIKPGRNSTFNVSATLPVYSWVRDTQLSPTIRLNTGLYYQLSTKKKV